MIDPQLSQQQRLQRSVDELAVRNLVVLYGMAVDCGDTAAAVALHTADARYIVSSPRAGRDDTETAPSAVDGTDLVLQGRDAIAAMLESDLHQSLLPNCAHTVGPLHVDIKGGDAVVTGYSRLYQRQGDDFKLLRVAVNRWQLHKFDSSWLISCRESRLVGEAAAQRILRAAVSGIMP